MSDEQTENAADFYRAVVDAYEDTDADYEAILAVMKEGTEILGEDSDIAEQYTDKISELVRLYIDIKDFESAKQYAGELSDLMPESDTAKELSEQTETIYNEEQPYVDTLLKAAEYIDAGDWQGLADFFYTDEVIALRNKIGKGSNYVYIYGGGTTGKGIGLYKMENYNYSVWYYGDMVDGKREGQGGWYYCTKDYGVLYIDNWTGEWSGDAPNGSQHNYYCNQTVIDESDGTVVDGLCDGVWTFTKTFLNTVPGLYEAGEVWTGSYTCVNGAPQEIEGNDLLKATGPDNSILYWISETGDNYFFALDTDRIGMRHYRHAGDYHY
jgi:hypothetical protein